MKTLAIVWGLGALALTGTIYSAQTDRPAPAPGSSLVAAAAPVSAYGAGLMTKPSTMATVRKAEAKAQKPAVKSAEPQKDRMKAQKRKKKNPVLATIRKVDRFLKRVL